MGEINLDQYNDRIREILREADLETTTAKAVRRRLEAEYSVDLNPYKKEIDERVLKILEEFDSESEEDEIKEETGTSDEQIKSESEVKKENSRTFLSPPPDKPVPTKRKNGSTSGGARKKVKSEDYVVSDGEDESLDGTAGDEELARRLQQEENSTGRRTRSRAAGSTSNTATKRKRTTTKRTTDGPKRETAFNRPLVLSPALSTFVGGAEEMSRTAVVKFIWEYVKSHDLQDPKDKRYIIVDDALRPIFGSAQRVHSFGMNKTLTKHMIKKEEMVGGQSFEDIDDDEDEEVGDRKPKRKAAPKARKRTGTPRKNAFNRPAILSAELGALVGETELPRPQVVKKIWEHIREHDLQDPSNRQFILCDDVMKRVFEVDRVSMFKMNSLLSRHITKKDDASVQNSDIVESDDDGHDDVKNEENSDISDDQADMDDEEQ